MPGVSLRGRDLVGSANLTREEQDAVLDRAAALKAEFRRDHRHAGHPLADLSIALIFEKPSLRTRVTFESGVVQLGGYPLYLAEGIGLGVRETVGDVARNLDRWVDGIVVRTFDHSVVTGLADAARVPVINALSDDEHPCQALADLLTLRERYGHLDGLVLTFVGDGNNVFHSLAIAGALAGMEVRLAHPPSYGPRPAIVERATAIAARNGGRIVVDTDAKAMVAGADAVYTDVWVSMGQEEQSHARLAAFRGYQVNAELLACARPDTAVMHCMPAHRGQEITDEALDGPNSVALEQAENRLHAQKGLLSLLLARA